jgi:hypothetical protein
MTTNDGNETVAVLIVGAGLSIHKTIATKYFISHELPQTIQPIH